MEILSGVRVSSFSVEAMHISWEVGASSAPPGVSWTFSVLRSQNPFSEYVPIVEGLPPDMNGYMDNTFSRYGPFRDFYYRVKAVFSTGDTQVLPGNNGARLEAEPNLYALEMARTESYLLQHVKGRKALLFQRRRSGARCPECFNPIQGVKTKSNCTTCYDTTFSGGYYRPLVCFVQVEEPRQNTITPPSGKVPIKQVMAKFSHYPLLREGDMLVEAENIRWAVGNNVNRPGLQRFPVRQEAILVAIDESAVEYKVPVEVDPVDWYGTQEENLRNRMDLTGGEESESALRADLRGKRGAT